MTDKEQADALANRLSQAWNGKAQFWVERKITEVGGYPAYLYEVKSDLINGLPPTGRRIVKSDLGL